MHPVNLHSGPYGTRIVGVYYSGGDSRGADGALFRQIQGGVLPGLAPIAGPVQGRRARSGGEGLRLGGVYSHRPEIQTMLRSTDPLPAGAVVVAAIQAAIGPSEDGVGFGGVQCERPYSTLQGERLAHPEPALTAIRAVP